MINHIADQVTVRFIIQALTLIVVLINIFVLVWVVKQMRFIKEEQNYLLDYRKELQAIRNNTESDDDVHLL
jgi:hypothetical protein